jgi:hypothetical protein
MDALVMDQRVVWDAGSLKQIDEAKAIIMKYKRRGYEILLASGEKMEKWSPSYEEVVIKATKVLKKTMKILSQTGDDRIVWDNEDGPEAMEAKAKFIELLDKGYKAYSVDVNGKKNHRIKEFDVEAEEILMVPKTAKG